MNPGVQNPHLGAALLDKLGLNFREFGLVDAFNGDDVFADRIAHRRQTGSHGLIVHFSVLPIRLPARYRRRSLPSRHPILVP